MFSIKPGNYVCACTYSTSHLLTEGGELGYEAKYADATWFCNLHMEMPLKVHNPDSTCTYKPLLY